MKALNVRQEKFAQLVASGVPAMTAYVEAGYSNKGRNAKGNASALMGTHGVALRINELRKTPEAQGEQVARATLEEKRRVLAELIRTPVVVGGPFKMGDKLRAIDLDSKLAGHFEPEQVVIETGPKTLESIEARAKEIVSAQNRRAKRDR